MSGQGRDAPELHVHIPVLSIALQYAPLGTKIFVPESWVGKGTFDTGNLWEASSHLLHSLGCNPLGGSKDLINAKLGTQIRNQRQNNNLKQIICCWQRYRPC